MMFRPRPASSIFMWWCLGLVVLAAGSLVHVPRRPPDELITTSGVLAAIGFGFSGAAVHDGRTLKVR